MTGPHRELAPPRLADSARQALALLVDGHVQVDVTAEYDLADFGTALEDLANGTTHGKSILRIT